MAQKNPQKNLFSGKHVLVTGGAGAFGQKFIRHLLDAPPEKLIVYSRDEMKHAALKRQFQAQAPWLECRIGDVCSPEDLGIVMAQSEIVIHAAAMKHLPECEANVGASTTTNIYGTQVVARAFLRSSAKVLIFLSTDKAPYASSVYGAQKYAGEKIVTETSRLSPQKRCFSLRYSNVIDSTGAAFLIFGEMLKSGRKVTVNGSQTVRGFVTQNEVISCLEEALKTTLGGENIVLKPRVIRISDLATHMCHILGKGEVEIREESSFLGEKDSATLIMDEELPIAKEFREAQIESYLLDNLKRHAKRGPAALPCDGAFTLEHCETLDGKSLESFLIPVMQTNNLI